MSIFGCGIIKKFFGIKGVLATKNFIVKIQNLSRSDQDATKFQKLQSNNKEIKMKPVYILMTIVLILGLVSYSEAQIDSTAFYIRFRQHQRKLALKAGRRSGIRSKRNAIIDCDGFMYFYEPCRQFR